MTWTAPFERDGSLRWLVWLGVGLFWHLFAILMNWLLCRCIDLSLLTPWTYSQEGWVLTVGWYWLWLWLWVNE